MNERRFEQKFDIIVTRTRLTLDIDKGIYPGDSVTFYLNGTTGKISHILEDVLRDGVPYIKEDFEIASSNKIGFTCAFHMDRVYFHILKKSGLRYMREGSKVEWKEIYRFSIGKDTEVYTKYGATNYNEKSRSSIYSVQEISDDGVYKVGYGKSALPFSVQNWEYNVSRYVNEEDGGYDGFCKVIQNIAPIIFNVSGNVYKPILGYAELFEYFSIVENGLTCQKKSGKKQDYIDKMTAFELPELQKPSKEQMEWYNCDEIKLAEICKVEGADEPTCVVRTYSYIKSIDVLFEGGRIYVTKKTAEFCKKNNAGDYVAQAFLSKIEHWDFEVEKFPESETTGTKLEYFGHIINEIEPENRAVAIWMFLREPFMESLAKLTSCGFIDAIIENLRDAKNIDELYHTSLGVYDKGAKKIFSALGINKQQFEEMKDIFPDSLGYSYYDSEDEKYKLVPGMVPFIKEMIAGLRTSDISSIDINTFKIYLSFAIELYSMKDVFKASNETMHAVLTKVLDAKRTTLIYYPTINITSLFQLFEQMAGEYIKAANRYHHNENGYFQYYDDYLRMTRNMDDMDLYKPKFKTLDEMVLAHDNLSIYSQVRYNREFSNEFKKNHDDKWKKWEFLQEEERTKNGEIKKEALKWMVIAPKDPVELVKEGTLLHHCVKTYIERVAKGSTNIMFIREVNEPNIPFFTVEVSNDGKIEQVHGFGNRNADTEPGLEEFVETWAKARRLKIHEINKVR